QELAAVITRYWDMNGGTDLARFARLTSTGVQYMLYATPVTGDLVLALAFDASTPFSRIRLQAADLAHALTVPPPEPASEAPRPRPTEKTSEPEEEPEEVEPIDISSLPPLFEDVPPPNPEPVTSDWVHETQPEQAQPAPAEASTRVEVAIPAKQPSTAAEAEEPPTFIREEGAPPELEPVAPGLYDLNYACVLLPRFSHHYLTGELAAKLAGWTPDICLGFGWRLEGLSIRPDYMQWIVRVLPATAPGVMIRQMRQALSQRIFETFPHLQYENLLGDFWAPGYLVVGGTQMATGQMVRDFITQTRQRQGMR
ncbi:MAG: transposase, partial [Anaerolineaceae bacterium]